MERFSANEVNIAISRKADPDSKVERLAGLTMVMLYTVGAIALAGLGLKWAAYGTPFPRDDTDSSTERSNMKPLTDYGTGCQYLRAGEALTPRLTVEGKPMCGKHP